MGDWPGNIVAGNIVNAWAGITASASAHVKGAWTELSYNVAPGEVVGMEIFVEYGVANYQYLIDIGIGPAGSEKVIFSNLTKSATTMSTIAGPKLFVPIRIPAGTRIAARMQCNGTGSKTATLTFHLFCAGFESSSPGNSVVCYGANLATTRGVSIDPGAVINTLGAWHEITASCAALKGVAFGYGNQLNVARTWCQWWFEMGIGAAGSEKVVLTGCRLCADNGPNYLYPQCSMFYPVSIPAGSRLAIRAQCNITDATDRLYDAFIYGLL